MLGVTFVTLFLSAASLPLDETTSGDVAAAEESVCVSRDCINTAYNLLQNVNLTADPCEDFFEVNN